MSFLYPLAFFGFLSLGAIVLMYMLKQKQTIEAFSTTMLWEKALLRTMAQKPWQKLRKNILMFLQLIAAALLTFALANPIITGQASAGEYVLVLDCSYNMQAVEGSESRFEHAKQEAIQFVESSPAGSVFTVVAARKNPVISVNITDNKRLASESISSLEASNESADTNLMESLLHSLNKEDTQFVIFSGMGFGFNGINAVDFPVGEKSDNLSITSMSHSVDSDKIVVMVKVKNFGLHIADNSVALYADSVLYDIKPVQIAPGEEVNVFFTSVPHGSLNLSAELTKADALLTDNNYYDVVKYNEKRQALLFTDNNVFLENALKLLPNIELYQGNIEDIDSASGYYLYIYDGVLPETLPIDGHSLVFDPPHANDIISFEDEMYIDSFIINDRSFLSNINRLEFDILTSKVFDTPAGASVILSSLGRTIAYSHEDMGIKRVVFGFDLHNTDLPLKKEFPIFIYNIVNWFIPENIFQGAPVKAGESVNINVYPDSDSVSIALPGGGLVELSSNNTGTVFNQTSECGFYTVEQRIGSKVVFNDFAVNIDISDNSDLNKEYSFSDGKSTAGIKTGYIDISNWIILVCIIIVLIEWYILSKGKFVLPDLIRAILVLLLFAALFNINFSKLTDNVAAVIVADVSDSIRNEVENMEHHINEGLAAKGNKDIAGFVEFSSLASIRHLVEDEPFNININNTGEVEYTDISKGLMAAMGILPEGYNKKIILVSDGNENVGDAISTARQLKDMGVMIDVLPVSTSSYTDAQISAINLPTRVGKGMNYNIEINTYSNGDNKAQLNIYKNNMLVISSDIDMKSGENRYMFTDTADIGGNISYRAEIIPEKDYIHQNNKAYAYSFVDDVPKVLVVDNNGSGREIEKILSKSVVEYESAKPQALQSNIEALNQYDAIILANINYEDMPEEFGALLDSYVKNGGGLIVSGGDNSYALGGYFNTPLENVLPVNMELKSKEETPDQSMVIVLDRSGSMTSGRYGVSKLSMAKESVIRSVDALNEEDYFGVLAFDTLNLWVVDLEVVGSSKDSIINKVAQISEGGGTSIKPAVIEAVNKLLQTDTKLKHIILLTDGQDGDREYGSIIDWMKENGITMSTVAVGGDSDTKLLEELAVLAEGRYYFTDEFSDLPKIFTKEAFLSGKKHLNNEEFYATLGAPSPITDSINGLPPFYGYVSTTPKTRADVLLYALNEEPLLASWQYGIGRSVAFMSDMEGNWSRDLLLTDEGLDLFNNMVSWVVRKNIGMDIYAKAIKTPTSTEITLNLPYTTGLRGVEAIITTPGLDEVEAVFTQVSPGEYKAEIGNFGEGTYIAALSLIKDGLAEYATCGINVSYSQEYDLRQMNFGQGYLERLAIAGGGRLLTREDGFFRYNLQKNSTKINLKPAILVIAILFLLFDIAYHRFNRIREFLRFKKISSTIKKNADSAELSIGSENIKARSANVSLNNTDNKQAEKEVEATVSTSAKLASIKKKRSGR